MSVQRAFNEGGIHRGIGGLERLLTPAEVGGYLGLSLATVTDWLRAGKIQGLHVGKAWRVRESDLFAYIAEAAERDEEKYNQKQHSTP